MSTPENAGQWTLFSLYLFYKDNDQGQVIERIEDLFKEKQSSTAYKASTSPLVEELNTFSNPTQHTRMMIFLRALIFHGIQRHKRKQQTW